MKIIRLGQNVQQALVPQTNINTIALVAAGIAVLFSPLRKLAVMGLIGKVVYDEINALYNYQGTLNASSILTNILPATPQQNVNPIAPQNLTLTPQTNLVTAPANVISPGGNVTSGIDGFCKYGCGV